MQAQRGGGLPGAGGRDVELGGAAARKGSPKGAKSGNSLFSGLGGFGASKAKGPAAADPHHTSPTATFRKAPASQGRRRPPTPSDSGSGESESGDESDGSDRSSAPLTKGQAQGPSHGYGAKGSRGPPPPALRPPPRAPGRDVKKAVGSEDDNYGVRQLPKAGERGARTPPRGSAANQGQALKLAPPAKARPPARAVDSEDEDEASSGTSDAGQERGRAPPAAARGRVPGQQANGAARVQAGAGAPRGAPTPTRGPPPRGRPPVASSGGGTEQDSDQESEPMNRGRGWAKPSARR
ncbi:hypothetical protein V8C86DRAFT_2794434 [Haematococcus lacustris]